MEDQDKPSYIKGLAWVLAAIGIGTLFAYGIAPVVRAIPWSWEMGIANVVEQVPHRDICYGNENQKILLDRLVTRLYPLDQDDHRFSINVHILNNPNINAFAELGGRIYLNRGLLEKAGSAEEVAGVLAHEITHVSHRHILEGFVVQVLTFQGLQLFFTGSLSHYQWMSYFLHMGFTRGQEAEADEGALIRLQKAHISNQGFGAFFQRLKEMASSPDFLSDHPSSEDRYEMVKKFSNQDTKPIMTDDEFKDFKGYCQ